MKKYLKILLSFLALIFTYIFFVFTFRYEVIWYYVLNIYLWNEKENYEIELIEFIGMYDDYRVTLIDKKENKKRKLILELKDFNVRYDSYKLP